MDLDDLTRQQRSSLWLDDRPGLHSLSEAMAFLRDVALALRYNPGRDVPLASMYRATQRQVPVPEDEQAAHARAFELTNGLLANGSAVEINLIANRLALAHERLMPALYALRRGGAEPRLSDAARQAFDFIEAHEVATIGDIRRHLRVEGHDRPDPADLALGELQRELMMFSPPRPS